MAETAPYGSWTSPITPAALAAGGAHPEFPVADGDDVFWLEDRPAEDGRSVLVRRGADGSLADVASVRTLVHEYGGLAYAARGGVVVASLADDQRVWRLDAPEPVALTPEPPAPLAWRYADHELSPDGRWVLCVRERHADGVEAVNDLVAIPVDGGGDGAGEPVVLAEGHDFFLAPRLSPDGRRLAWITWDHPDMPWDAAELWVADVDPAAMTVSGPRRLAGGDGVAAGQPHWSPAGELHFVDDRTGWWLPRREGAPDVPLVAGELEFGVPEWVAGLSTFAFLADGTLVATWVADGLSHLGVVADGGVEEIATPLTFLAELQPQGDAVVCLAGSPSHERAIVRVGVPGGEVEVLRAGDGGLDLDEAFVSPPRAISFPTAGGATAHALFFAPRNPGFSGPADERPPLIVGAHGGPTGAFLPTLNADIQFWTSRGIAFAAVNCRGSTGYGRAYRDALRGQWGIADVEDSVACARFLAEQGEVDGDRLVARGGSAGGFTTLAALTGTDAFAAGSSHFGVADLERLAEDTHKLESRYLDGLIGPWPEARALFRERSPITHADGLSAPLILFQGGKDPVVPPSQAHAMADVLEAKGIPHALIEFPEESHGFRRAESVERVAQAELSFLGLVLGFTPAGELPPLDVRHAEALPQ